MGKAYSMDLRVRIVAYVDAGNSARSAGRRYGVSASTAVRLAAAARSGSLAPKPQGRVAGSAGKLAPHRGFLAEIVAAEPDITLQELAAALEETHGVVVHLSSVHRALRRAGLTYKKRPDRPGARPGRAPAAAG